MTNEIEVHQASNAIAPFQPMQWDDIFQMATAIADTDFVPDKFRRKPGAVAACILTGQELGIKPMISLQEINVIKGKVGGSALLMRAKILSEGHKLEVVELSNTRCTMKACRRGETETLTMTYTSDDAKTAGLLGNQNYKNNPRAMLSARCTSAIARLKFPDVILGIPYTPDELEQISDGEFESIPEEILGSDSTSKPNTAKRKSSAAKPAQSTGRKPKADPAPPPPVDDDEVVDAVVVEEQTQPEESEPAEDDGVLRRARYLAFKAKEAGVDHHHLINAVTAGEKESAKEITVQEYNEAIKALSSIVTGQAELRSTDIRTDADDQPVMTWHLIVDSSQTVSEEQGTNSPPYAEWTDGQWRGFLRENNISVVHFLRHASSLEHNLGSLKAVAESDVEWKVQLHEWVLGQ